jgi:PAS domain S-box-containing protein
LVNQGNLRGILYLENDQTSQIITRERLEILKLLTIQATVSLENAELYNQRKQAEAIARTSESRFRYLFEQAPLCIFELDVSQQSILSANRQAELVYGWSAEEFVNLPIGQIIPEEIVSKFQGEEVITAEGTSFRRNGTAFDIRLIASPDIEFGNGRMVAIIEDITAQKQIQIVTEAVEEERRRISRDIHDSIGQVLTGIRIRIGSWADLVKNDPEQMLVELGRLREILSDSIQELRRCILALQPINLDRRDFFTALRRLLMDFNELSDLQVDLEIVGEEHLPDSLELVIFRVAQEALNNVYKHAQATVASVVLNLEGANITLTIRDNGQGFDTNILGETAEYGHWGLTQMRERVEQVRGRLLIQSWPGQGTEIQAIIPRS